LVGNGLSLPLRKGVRNEKKGHAFRVEGMPFLFFPSGKKTKKGFSVLKVTPAKNGGRSSRGKLRTKQPIKTWFDEKLRKPPICA